MTSRPPCRRLVDVLRQNSLSVLRKNAHELACANQALRAENIQTRFLRNAFLIPPQSLCLLQQPNLTDTLTSWHMFALYKPPFCPMRRTQAKDNYHHVSVESFVDASLRSRAVWPTLKRVLAPQEMHVRVLYDLDAFASGPVVVRVSDGGQPSSAFAPATLRQAVMEYDVMVAGHLPVGRRATMDTAALFPDCMGSGSTLCDESGAMGPISSTVRTSSTSTTSTMPAECSYEVRCRGYYRVHAVSMLTVRIAYPPTAKAPAIADYVRQRMGTYVMGDPYAMREVVQGTGGGGRQDDMVRTSFNESEGDDSAVTKRGELGQGIIALRGDCDFPRVFVHLRSVIFARGDWPQEGRAGSRQSVEDGAGHSSAKVRGAGVAGAENDASVLRFHCNNCFEPIVKSARASTLRERQLSILDGTWTPASEHMA